VHVIVFLAPLAALCACATSEDVPRFGLADGGFGATDGSSPGPGGQGNGGAPNTGAFPNNGGQSNGGGANPGGASGTCVAASCPSCSATLGQTCCRNDGTCGCKAFFGLLNCM
jgi:hypothetical protein